MHTVSRLLVASWTVASAAWQLGIPAADGAAGDVVDIDNMDCTSDGSCGEILLLQLSQRIEQVLPMEERTGELSDLATSVNDSLVLSTGLWLGQQLVQLRPSERLMMPGPRVMAAAMFVLVVIVALGYAMNRFSQEPKGAETLRSGEKAKEERRPHESPVPIAGQLILSNGSNEEKEKQNEADWRFVVFFACGHCLSASFLTIANKWAMNEFHPPVVAGGNSGVYVWTLTTIQFIVAASFAKLGGILGLFPVEPLEFRKALAFFPAAGMFMITIVAGNAVMNYSSVNAFLILRALVPMPVALCEMFVYGDPCPPIKSWLSLGVIVAGAFAYALVTGGLELHSVSWAIMFLVLMPIDAIVIKHQITASGLKPWSLVYYNNVLAAIPCFFFVLIFELQGGTSAWSHMFHALTLPGARIAVPVSCILGISISFFQLNTRYYISATGFMVLGVLNKFITVLVNQAILDRQGVPAMISVCICLLGAVLWQQSVKGGSIQVRTKPEGEQHAYIPFLFTIVALLWAGIVEFQNIHWDESL